MNVYFTDRILTDQNSTQQRSQHLGKMLMSAKKQQKLAYNTLR